MVVAAEGYRRKATLTLICGIHQVGGEGEGGGGVEME